MEPRRPHSGSTPATRRLDPPEPAWQEYYAEAARRRRARRHTHRTSQREAIRRRNRIQTVLMVSSFALLGLLFAIFQRVLTP
jgi:hypothetical protein